MTFVGEAADRVREAGELLFSGATGIHPAWLLAGVALHLAAQVVRVRGWWNILRAAYPRERVLRVRQVAAASMAGCGLDGLLPAHAGYVVKLSLLHKRIAGSSYATLAATALPETLFETLCG